MKDGMNRNTKLAAVLCLAALGTAIAARADCRHVRGTDVETIIPSPNDPLGRVLGDCGWRAERRQHGGRHKRAP